MRPNPRVYFGCVVGLVSRWLSDVDDRFGIEPPECRDQSGAPEVYGPTDLNAQLANQHLAVGVNQAGTITVFRYPTPSYYDQIKYLTTDRADPFFGAAPNEGAFLGLIVEPEDADGEPVFEPLRSWATTQTYADGDTDTLVTTHTSDRWGLDVTVTDVVPPAVDGLVRDVTVTRAPDSAATAVSLVAYENFNLVGSKLPDVPVRDWCLEFLNRDRAAYLAAPDALTHLTRESDTSTGMTTTVATAIGFAGASTQHQVGGDAFESTGRDPSFRTVPVDAYTDAADGRLEGNGSFQGQTTGALATSLSFTDGVATERLFITAAHTTGETAPPTATRDRAVDRLTRLRAGASTADLRAAKREWVTAHLADAPLPATDDPAILAVCRRALVTLVTTFHPDRGAIVASIATQSPYAEDWPRDSAFFNYVLDLIGKSEWVTQRTRWFADLQERRLIDVDPFRPPGNWAMNYYADGVPGGPIPWEIDETGFMLWAFWDHYKATGDRAYLEGVYDAIARAADFLTLWWDPRSGLHLRAWEDDNTELRQTIVGAGPVWLGLDAAVKAAETLGHRWDATLWRIRRDALADGIETTLFDADGGFYGSRARPGFPELLWPIAFHPYDDPRMRSHADRAWQQASPSLAEPAAGERATGQYEPKVWLALAKLWADDPTRLEQVRAGIRWSARQHATTDTRVMGEAWRRIDGEIVSAVSQPHLWEQCLLYLAALEAFPPVDEETSRRSRVGGWLEVLRDDAVTRQPGG